VTAPPDEPDNRRPAGAGQPSSEPRGGAPAASGRPAASAGRPGGSWLRSVGSVAGKLVTSYLAHGMIGDLLRGVIPGRPYPETGGTDSPVVQAKAADRVIFFSDAVVAIAITLLALQLPVPDDDNGPTLHQYLVLVGKSWESYLAFLISFVVIAGHWNGHRRVFRYVNRLGGPVVGLNTAWLMMMILTPFGARLLDSDGGFPIRFTTYALIQVIALFCMLRINQEVNRRDLLRADTPDSFRHRDSMPTLVTIAMFLASIPVSFFTEWSFAVWGAIPLAVDGVRRVRIIRGIGPGGERVL
jgi:uncharacterized membrane protein